MKSERQAIKSQDHQLRRGRLDPDEICTAVKRSSE